MMPIHSMVGSALSYCPRKRRPIATAKNFARGESKTFSVDEAYSESTYITHCEISSSHLPTKMRPKLSAAKARIGSFWFYPLKMGSKIVFNSSFALPAYAIPKPIIAPSLVASSFESSSPSSIAFAV